jgi:hypothetical protein
LQGDSTPGRSVGLCDYTHLRWNRESVSGRWKRFGNPRSETPQTLVFDETLGISDVIGIFPAAHDDPETIELKLFHIIGRGIANASIRMVDTARYDHKPGVLYRL